MLKVSFKVSYSFFFFLGGGKVRHHIILRILFKRIGLGYCTKGGG